MITKKTISYKTIKVYSPDGELFGELNHLELIDLRIQIIENQVSGYFFIHNDIKIFIQTDGELSESVGQDFGDGMLELVSRFRHAQEILFENHG